MRKGLIIKFLIIKFIQYNINIGTSSGLILVYDIKLDEKDKTYKLAFLEQFEAKNK